MKRLMWATMALLAVLVGTAFGQLEGAVGDLAGTPKEWAGLFSSTDLVVMTGIGIITFFLDRAETIKNRTTLLVPLIAGGVWGLVDVLGTPVEGALVIPAMIRSVVRAGILNGAVAGLMAVTVQRTLAAVNKATAG